jgi:hypothetical protein
MPEPIKLMVLAVLELQRNAELQSIDPGFIPKNALRQRTRCRTTSRTNPPPNTLIHPRQPLGFVSHVLVHHEDVDGTSARARYEENREASTFTREAPFRPHPDHAQPTNDAETASGEDHRRRRHARAPDGAG